jgi:hypothetical protein
MKNKIQLSKRREFDISIPADTYAGVQALPYVTAAVKSPDTVAKGLCRQIDGLTKSAVINNIASTAPVMTAGCDFLDNASTSVSEQVLTLVDYRVNESICRGTVFPTWMGQGMDRNGNLPNTFSDFLLQVVAGKAGEQIENGIWRGSLVPGNANAGFVSTTGVWSQAQLDASACQDFSQVAISTITNANATDQLAKVYNDVVTNSPSVLAKTGFGFYVSQKTYGLYAQELGTNTTFQQLGAAGTFGSLTYLGYPVYVAPGLFDDGVIVATYPENLVFGTNLATDWTEARLIPAYEYDGSDNVKIIMQFALGVQTAVAGDGSVGYKF